MYNTKKRLSSSQQLRHSKDRETPLVIYLSLLIFQKTRCRELIDIMHNHGIGISYARVLEISAGCGQSVVNKYFEEGVVYPVNGRENIFTCGMIDNIDVDYQSKMTKDSFHGTAISIAQFPTTENAGTLKASLGMEFGQENVDPLPDFYTVVPAVALKNKEPRVPFQNRNIIPVYDVRNAKMKENEWLSHVKRVLDEGMSDTDFISWAAFFSSRCPQLTNPKSTVSLLPLFHEVAHYPSMILHGMHIVRAVTEYLNPGQTPFMTADQPLYAIMKQLQWEHPNDVGEDKFLTYMGGLHIEMVTHKMLGQWLDGSGWSTVLSESGVTTSGRADNAVKGGHVTRARYFHQVTAASLYILQQDAYKLFSQELSAQKIDAVSFEEWCEKKCLSSLNLITGMKLCS